METWKIIKEFPKYEISDFGRVRNLKSKTEVKGCDSNGYKRLYLRKRGERVCYLVHRLVALAFIDNPEHKPFVDHINGERSDNRRENLRWATNSQNQMNKRKTKGSSKYKGVYRRKGRWFATIQYESKGYAIGQYESEEDAGKAYDLKALELFGQFAKLNFPMKKYV